VQNFHILQNGRGFPAGWRAISITFLHKLTSSCGSLQHNFHGTMFCTVDIVTSCISNSTRGRWFTFEVGPHSCHCHSPLQSCVWLTKQSRERLAWSSQFWLLASLIQTVACKHSCFCRLEPSIFKTIRCKTLRKLQKSVSNIPTIQQYGLKAVGGLTNKRWLHQSRFVYLRLRYKTIKNFVFLTLLLYN